MHGGKTSPTYEGPMYFDEFQTEFAGRSTTLDKNFDHNEGLAYDRGFANEHFTEA